MRHAKFWLGAAAILGASVWAAGPASAITTCNDYGDCWQTDTRITFPGVTLSYHDDSWRDAHRDDRNYHWHDADRDHDWHHGYWERGAWHHMD